MKKLLIGLLFCLAVCIYGQTDEEIAEPYPSEEMMAFGGFEFQQFSFSKNVGLCLVRGVRAKSDLPKNSWVNAAKCFLQESELLIISRVTANKNVSMEPLNPQSLKEVSKFPFREEIMYRCNRLISCGFLTEVDSISLFNIWTNKIKLLVFRYTYLKGPMEKVDWLFIEY